MTRTFLNDYMFSNDYYIELVLFFVYFFRGWCGITKYFFFCVFTRFEVF